jgi:hypothetical protein
MARRLLRALGWEVQSVPYWEWEALGADVGAQLAYLEDWERPRAQERGARRGLALSIPHHETFSTTIQPPYSSTKG